MNHAVIIAAITQAALAAELCAQNLSHLYRIQPAVSSSHVEYRRVEIAAGKQTQLAALHGPGKVTYFYITDDTQGKFYPGLVLKVFWDGEPEPSIQSPLSDFFGAIGGKTIDYQSVPMQINHACFMCYLPMPFRDAKFVLENDGDKNYSHSMAYGIDFETGAEFAGEKSRLHCSWRRSNPVRQGLHTLLQARGRGQYIGNFLEVHTNYRGWWGEGDTIFEIDSKAVTHSPGTEDEYGSTWGFGHTYSYLYSGYLEMEKKDNRMYRWYLPNPVRFQASLQVEIQNQHWENGQVPSQDDYTSVAFWYQEEPHAPFALAPFAERTASSRAAEHK